MAIVAFRMSSTVVPEIELSSLPGQKRRHPEFPLEPVEGSAPLRA